MSEARIENEAQAAQTTSDSLLDQLLEKAKVTQQDEGYDVTKQAAQEFLKWFVRNDRQDEHIDRNVVDAMIAEIDQRISLQINEILHEPTFQEVESRWRELKHLVDRVDFRENIKINMLNTSKQDLADDFLDAPDITKSGLYRHVYSAEYGQHGGQPYGMVCGSFFVDPSGRDLQLLQKCAAVGAMAHVPFVTNVAPEMFGVKTVEEITRLKDLKAIFEGPRYAKWRSFRESEDARYLGLCMPRFLLRAPYEPRTGSALSFEFTEDTAGEHEKYLWGFSSTAMAERVAESFAQYRWCPNIIGPKSGGEVGDLPMHVYKSAMGDEVTMIPTESMITDRREFELAEEGFIALTYRKAADNACFFSASSCLKPKYFGESDEAKTLETDYRISTQLPYLFIITRIAHYIKVMQREELGGFKERQELQTELSRWLNDYVVQMDNPSPATRAKRPLRDASINVEEVPGEAGWYRCEVKVVPHLKYMGADFSLSLVGRLDK